MNFWDLLRSLVPIGTKSQIWDLVACTVSVDQYFLPRDKYNEVKVQEVKQAISRQNSALQDVTIQTLIGSLSVMNQLHRHNLKSRLAEFTSRQTSSDTVGDDRRQLLANIMEKNQPFDLTRPPVTDWAIKSPGSPFAGLSLETMAKFISSTKDKFLIDYPDIWSSPPAIAIHNSVIPCFQWKSSLCFVDSKPAIQLNI